MKSNSVAANFIGRKIEPYRKTAHFLFTRNDLYCGSRKINFLLTKKVFIKVSDLLRILEFMKKGKASFFTDSSSCNALQGDYDMHGISRKIITELANLKINL